MCQRLLRFQFERRPERHTIPSNATPAARYSSKAKHHTPHCLRCDEGARDDQSGAVVLVCCCSRAAELLSSLIRRGVGWPSVRTGGRWSAEVLGLQQLWSTRSEEHTSELQSLMRISYAV